MLGRFRFLQERAFLGTETPIISSATFQCLEDLAGRRWLLSSTTTVEYSSSSSSPTLSSVLSSPSSRLELVLFLLLRLFISDSRSLLLRNFTASCNSTWTSSATKRNEIHIHTHKHVHKFVAISYKVHTRWVSETIASVTSFRLSISGRHGWWWWSSCFSASFHNLFTLLSSNQTHSTAQFRRTSIPRRRKLSTKASRFSHFSTAKITDSDFRLLQKPRKTPWKKIKNKIRVSDSLSLSISISISRRVCSLFLTWCAFCAQSLISLSLCPTHFVTLTQKQCVEINGSDFMVTILMRFCPFIKIRSNARDQPMPTWQRRIFLIEYRQCALNSHVSLSLNFFFFLGLNFPFFWERSKLSLNLYLHSYLLYSSFF